MQNKFIGVWCWLLPLTYLAHIAEEYGGDFPAWFAAFSGAALTPRKFIALNAMAWALMLTGVAVAVWTRHFRWLVTAFGVTILVNGAAHFLASVATQTYSPGLVTGVLLWGPLGVWTLRRAWQCVARRVFWWGVGVGLLLHGAVTLAVILG